MLKTAKNLLLRINPLSNQQFNVPHPDKRHHFHGAPERPAHPEKPVVAVESAPIIKNPYDDDIPSDVCLADYPIFTKEWCRLTRISADFDKHSAGLIRRNIGRKSAEVFETNLRMNAQGAVCACHRIDGGRITGWEIIDLCPDAGVIKHSFLDGGKKAVFRHLVGGKQTTVVITHTASQAILLYQNSNHHDTLYVSLGGRELDSMQKYQLARCIRCPDTRMILVPPGTDASQAQTDIISFVESEARKGQAVGILPSHHLDVGLPTASFLRKTNPLVPAGFV